MFSRVFLSYPISGLCTGPLLVKTVILHLWQGVLTSHTQGYRLQKKLSFLTLLHISRHTPQSGYHRVAKTANIAKMAPSFASNNPMEPGLGNTLLAQN